MSNTPLMLRYRYASPRERLRILEKLTKKHKGKSKLTHSWHVTAACRTAVTSEHAARLKLMGERCSPRRGAVEEVV